VCIGTAARLRSGNNIAKCHHFCEGAIRRCGKIGTARKKNAYRQAILIMPTRFAFSLAQAGGGSAPNGAATLRPSSPKNKSGHGWRGCAPKTYGDLTSDGNPSFGFLALLVKKLDTGVRVIVALQLHWSWFGLAGVRASVGNFFLVPWSTYERFEEFKPPTRDLG